MGFKPRSFDSKLRTLFIVPYCFPLLTISQTQLGGFLRIFKYQLVACFTYPPSLSPYFILRRNMMRITGGRAEIKRSKGQKWGHDSWKFLLPTLQFLPKIGKGNKRKTDFKWECVALVGRDGMEADMGETKDLAPWVNMGATGSQACSDISTIPTTCVIPDTSVLRPLRV